ncbi:bifunctional diguanylate cyclase/phosphodiesterase [Desulfonatronum sp. SC1]|uniref:putative bifunctional diguanylate cyclase/phosphodiesterase n=1 Tax=Desulfonatronum sp. SC1 TaxID=2109626 RepID=UPI000D30E6D8|nr:EAL domain-containing protein [Desulfonatronum sp. SC1]PTN37916.1 GGDEF domain-containing response regulator [Desulfonatronum sp. SC1]
MSIDTDTASHRILVIDDNASIHEDFRKILHHVYSARDEFLRMEAELFGRGDEPAPVGFEVDFASQGQEGLEKVLRAEADGRPYALAFVDGRMPPGWDGIETISRLWEVSPELQVVFCTAYADYSWRDIQQSLGVTDSLVILKKPFENLEVLQLAHALARKWELNREVQGRLRQLAFNDTLTGLANRVQFMDRLGQALGAALRHGHQAALLFIDLDHFKRVNDSLGHGVGDELLQAVAERLRNCLRDTDSLGRPSLSGLAARLGGDEFTAILPEIQKAESAARVARRITEQLSQPIDLGLHRVQVTASIGIAMIPQDGDSVETLLKNADLAMYAAKRAGSNTYSFFQESMTEAAHKRFTLENLLRQAIFRNELSLHYQPQFDLSTGRVSGMEALLRWDSQELGSVSPREFIPVAEDFGLIIPIGEWVLRSACEQTAAWIAQGVDIPRIAVNVSMHQLDHARFSDMVQDILARTGLKPSRLEIEVTESLLAVKPERVLRVLRDLREVGVQVAIDDFGTGYASLSRLKELPVDCLKLDGSFIVDLNGGKPDQALMDAMIAMAAGLKLRVIAECVETTRQSLFLRDRKCPEVQGFHFGPPMPREQAEAFLKGQIVSAGLGPPNPDMAHG